MAHEHEYTCCGPMVVVEIPDIYDGVAAYLCETCGVWRHRFPPGDTRRPQVKAAMPRLVQAIRRGPRGEVS